MTNVVSPNRPKHCDTDDKQKRPQHCDTEIKKTMVTTKNKQKLADAKSTTSYSLGPTFLGIKM